MFTLFNKFVIIATVAASAIFGGFLVFGEKELFFDETRINGVNLVATNDPLTSDDLNNLTRVNPNWVAIVPYAFSQNGLPGVNFNYRRQWYGERTRGAIEAIVTAKEFGYKVMIKPHVWVRGEGWPGEFKLEGEDDWQKWEDEYTRYVLRYAGIADSLDADLLCIGTEFREAVKARPEYWLKLIDKVKKIYSGDLTYAANWDNYREVQFWDQLDYIGIDAYFPLTEAKQPEVVDLRNAWKPHQEELLSISEDLGKQILFTEYGYRSVEFCTKGPWESAGDRPVNMVAQKNAYEALYQTFWYQPWFAGGFLWKWHPDHENAGGVADRKFTPQNKHAQHVVAKWYGH